MRTRYRETSGLIQHPVRQFTLSSWAVLARWGKGRQGLHVKSWLIETKAFAQELQGTSLAVQWLRLHLPVQGNAGSIPGEGIKIPHASQPENQNIKQKQYCNKFNKDFKNGPHHLKKNLDKKKRKRITAHSNLIKWELGKQIHFSPPSIHSSAVLTTGQTQPGTRGPGETTDAIHTGQPLGVGGVCSTGSGAVKSGFGVQKEAFQPINLLTHWNIFKQRSDFGKLYFGKVTLAGVWGRTEGG